MTKSTTKDSTIDTTTMNGILEHQIVCPDDGSNHFGISVSMNSTGDRVVVGAFAYNSGQGKVYIYLKSDSSWILEQEIICPDNGKNYFGISVSINSTGDRVVIGAYNYNSFQGKVYVYVRSDNSWMLEQGIVCPDDGYNYFGRSVDINSTGERIIVGAYNYNSGQGKVYVYVKSDNSWILEQKLISPDSGSNHFGCSVNIDGNGDRIIIGANGYNSNQGKIYIYVRFNSSWLLEQEIICPDDGINYFGYYVSINSSGDKAVVGAHGYNSNRGKVYIYVRSSDKWLLETQIACPDNGSNHFSRSISMNNTGDRVVIGTHYYNSYQGKIYVYDRSGNDWILKTQITGPDTGTNSFGWSVGMNSTGSKIIVGAFGYNSGQGKVYIYT